METMRVCRLCLKTCDSFKAIEGDTKYVLNKLLPKIYLAAIRKPLMCANCAEIAIQCFNFKSAFYYVHRCIVSFMNKKKDAVKLDIKDVYLSKNKCTGVSDDHDICRFCMKPVKSCSIRFFKTEKEDDMLEKMTKQCFPELDLSTIKNTVICAPCHSSLEMYFRFVTNCLDVEDKIRKHCDTLNINSTDEIELRSLSQFTIRDVTREVDGNRVDSIKIENQLFEERENAGEREIGKGHDVIKLEQISCDDSENANVEVEHETKSCMNMTDLKFNNEEQLTPKDMFSCEGESNNLDIIKTEDAFCGENELKEENVDEMEDQKFLLNGEIKIKTDESDFYRLEDSVVLPQLEVTTRLCERQKCLKPDLQGEHTLNTRMYQCECCTFQCESCPFQTNTIRYLKKHALVHKDPSEVTMYKCDFCAFQTKYRVSMRKHLLIMHNSPSEVTIFECDSCSFQAKSTKYLKRHQLVHKDPSEVKMYKCDSCSFQTKYTVSIKKHLLKHKNPSEVKMYKCDSCSFQTKYKFSVKKHLLTHKHPSEVEMYKCDSCSFETKYKDDIKKHVEMHKDPSYKCDSCSFLSTSSKCLKRHLLTHKDPSDVTVYKCDSCPFQTIHKDYLDTY